MRDTNEFAERIGITQAHLSGVENNKDNPSDSVLQIICNEFNIGRRWPKSGEGEKRIQFMSREEFIEKLPLEDRPESDEKKLLFIFNHPMPKVRDEFFALLRVYHAIIPTCDTPNGFGVLEIQTLELILSVIHDCFDRCNLQVQSLPDKISAVLSIPNKSSISQSVTKYSTLSSSNLGNSSVVKKAFWGMVSTISTSSSTALPQF